MNAEETKHHCINIKKNKTFLGQEEIQNLVNFAVLLAA